MNRWNILPIESFPDILIEYGRTMCWITFLESQIKELFKKYKINYDRKATLGNLIRKLPEPLNSDQFTILNKNRIKLAHIYTGENHDGKIYIDNEELKPILIETTKLAIALFNIISKKLYTKRSRSYSQRNC